MSSLGVSVLIPVYNCDVRALVYALQQQAMAQALPVELLCWEDASDPAFLNLNAELSGLAGVDYRVLPENLGRSRIRNRLAAAAAYDYLLFMDGDSAVIRPDYLKTYISQLSPESLLYGGRAYQAERPSDPSLVFHWEYGRKREVQPPQARQQRPYHSFMTNNFLIPKALFMPIQFDSRLLQYGHEDTLFGMELRQRAIPVRHLDNPLRHDGLEPAAAFLRKSEQAIQNLAFLVKAGHPIDTRLLRVYQKLERWQLTEPLRLVLKRVHKSLYRHLRKNSNPSLKVFDLYKLGLLLHYLRR